MWNNSIGHNKLSITNGCRKLSVQSVEAVITEFATDHHVSDQRTDLLTDRETASWVAGLLQAGLPS